MSCSIELKNVSQSFDNNYSGSNASEKNTSTITLFENLDLSINQGQSYAITGPSGSVQRSGNVEGGSRLTARVSAKIFTRASLHVSEPFQLGKQKGKAFVQ